MFSINQLILTIIRYINEHGLRYPIDGLNDQFLNEFDINK